ncbi:hypothetical protein QVD17_35172 [Tagetes erecta]|uniref:Uncharacterized protein n=1 Tax=Tagetes erecta TaxID=13708 RepID=A0AAD8K0J2_TARER|nr:hypothetical protein QVD17_35172 [Tagetes erecta]
MMFLASYYLILEHLRYESLWPYVADMPDLLLREATDGRESECNVRVASKWAWMLQTCSVRRNTKDTEERGS